MSQPPDDASSQNETSYTFVDSDQETDEFELLDHERERRRSDPLSCSSVSALSSVYEDELIHGRRYHGYKKGRYPLPNDEIEQQREEMSHTLMIEIAVSIPTTEANVDISFCWLTTVTLQRMDVSFLRPLETTHKR
jgi:hypothetical protein